MLADSGQTVVIKLAEYQISMACHIAVMRRVQNMINKVPPKYGATNSNGSWELDMLSCQAELAVAKYLNLYWDGSVGDYDAPDVGGCVEVRCRRRIDYELIMYKKDKSHLPFVLVFGQANSPEFLLKGWAFGYEGKLDEYWRDPAVGRPAYFVPHEVLRPMSELWEAYN